MGHYRSEWIKCGKGCSKCPHGPYWYYYWYADGKKHKKYIGKKLHGTGDDKKADTDNIPQEEKQHPWDDICNPRTATFKLACLILGLPEDASMREGRLQYYRLARIRHPDVGGTNWLMSRTSAAWEVFQDRKKFN